jgi:hypothetical protein
VPGRRALGTMRFATAGAALLLVLAFAADRTDLFQQNPFSNRQFGADTLDFGTAGTAEEGESYWVVSGVKNSVDPVTESVENTTVSLVVPDGSDNVYAAVTSLSQANDGVLYADVAASTREVPQSAPIKLVVSAGAGTMTEEFTVVSAPDTEWSPFATNSVPASSALDSIMKEQVGTYLNMVPADSDNSVLYSFYLGAAEREFKAAPNHNWLRPLEYGLIGMVVVLAGATLALWFRQRRPKAAEVS